MENLIIVGCGDHFRTNVGPTLASMESTGVAKVIATVDLEPLSERPVFLNERVPHIIRTQGKKLSRCLRKYSGANAVVVLAHTHDLHASDALDLVSHGFRVIVEKPYALRTADLILLRDAMRKMPKHLALAEYYLMMKASPLLHAAGLLKPDSFYLREPGFLEDTEGSSRGVESLVGVLDSIGRPRMVYVDLLEGEGLTGRFEHRGRQFADSRSGIGVILDLAIHSLAPVIALEGLLGSLPPASKVSLATAVCESFVGFAGSTHNVPAQFVPETYAELALTTSTGIPLIATVGKYVLRSENQRRLIIVGDEGEALLDMSNCTLSVTHGDQCPTVLLRAPKHSGTKYLSVFRACLLSLMGETPYNFDAPEAALRSNEFTFELHARSCEQGADRKRYPSGAAPGTIIQNQPSFEVQQNASVPVADNDGAKLYYEHQYERLGAIEEQGFKMSAGVLVLTAAVFTFASRVGSESFLPWKVAVVLMACANFAAIFYMWRVRVSIKGHQKRAKTVLKKVWPEYWEMDRNLNIEKDHWQMRSLIIGCLHGCVLLAAGWILFSPQQNKNQQTAPQPQTQQPANSQMVPTTPPPVQPQPQQKKP